MTGQIYTRVSGGLGNQLFQYAAARSLARRTGFEPVLVPFGNARPLELDLLAPDCVKLGGTRAKWGRLESLAARLPYRLANGKAVRQITDPGHAHLLSFDELPSARSYFLNGYWQSERYFLSDAEAIRETLRSRLPEPEFALELAGLRWASVHFRRGDLVTNAMYAQRYGVLPDSYYEAAVGELRDVAPGLDALVVFSDSPLADESTRLARASGLPVFEAPVAPAIDHLALMSRAEAHICANSSFSWWGAWLSGSDAVVFPAVPFRDPELFGPYLCPDRWSRV